MSAKDSLPRKQSSNSRINKQNAYRVLSHELQSPSTDLLRSRCDDTQIFCAREAGGSHFRSQSEIVYSLQERDGSLIRDNQRCQEFCPSNGRNFHESKLPKITQGDAATNKHLVGDWKAIATDSIKRSRAKSTSVLPDLSGSMEKVVKFRPATPLTKQQVEDLNDKVAASHDKSHDLAKWLRDQQ